MTQRQQGLQPAVPVADLACELQRLLVIVHGLLIVRAMPSKLAETNQRVNDR